MDKPEIRLIENFISNPNELFEVIQEGIRWDNRLKRRKTASFGVAYNYSGMTYPQTEMMTELIPICLQIKNEIGFAPNNCLLNYYAGGNSTMGYHSDNSEDLQEGTGVVIISLGAERYISYRSKLDKLSKYKYLLQNGSLLYMDNLIQKNWMHAIPKQRNIGERISLTFRQIVKLGS